MATSKVMGTVTSVVGEVKATASDGTVRVLQVGDKVFSDEVISTSPNGDVKIALEGGGGQSLECGADATLALNEGLLGTATAVTAQQSTPATPPTAPGADVAALQAAIASGADPTQVAQATAAGGAPGAGGAEGGGSHSPVIVEQGNTAGVVSSGFNTQGAGIQFPTPEFNLTPVEENPVVSVSVQVQVDVENPNEPGGTPGGGVVVSGNAANLIEGTNGAEGKLVNFIITLDKAFDTDVQVTYSIMPGTASTPSDFFDGPLTQTVTIAAGETQIIVPVTIVQDHLVESNETFNIVLTDAVNATINPDANTAVVTIIDDDTAPVAHDDTNWAQEDIALTASGNVLQTIDHSTNAPSGTFGDNADTDADGDSPAVTTQGTFVGKYGTLELHSDGTYVYTLNNELQVVQDLAPGDQLTDEVFTYTVSDGFNDPSSATLQIIIFGSDDAPHIFGLTPEAQGGDVILNENDLLASRGENESDGSDPSKESTTQPGTFNISAPDGVDDLTIGGHAVITDGVFTATSFTTALGNTLSIIGYNESTGEISYTYTLQDNESHPSGSDANSLFENFSVVLTDVDGSSDTDTLSVNIVDDVPTAVANTNGVDEGALLSVNAADGVLTNDTAGADGAVVTGVRAAGGDTTTAASGGVNTDIAGLYGTLHLNADGSYTYQSNANTITANVSDVFVYTIQDGDGDLSTTTLTINLTDSGLTAGNDDEVVVNEAALDLNKDGSDLVAGTVTGSLPGSTAETDATNTLTDNVTGGFGTKTYALVGSATGTYGTIQINSDGTYVYTLAKPYDSSTANNSTNTEQNVDTFTYQVTDANGNTSTGTISVDIVDDVPSVGPAQTGVLENAPGVSLTAALSVTEGADGASVKLSATHNGAYWTEGDGTTFLTSGGVKLLYVENPDGSLSAVVEGTSNIVFTVTANQGSDTYTVTLSPTYLLDGATQTFDVDFTQALGGGNTANVFFGSVASGIVVWATATDPATVGGDTVNFSNTGAGVNQGDMISGSESLMFKMLDPDHWTITLGNNPPAPTNDSSSDLYIQFSTVTLTIDSLDGGHGKTPAEQMQVTAWHTETDGLLTQVTINQQVWSGTGTGSSDDDVFTIFSTDGNTFDTLIFTSADGTDYRVASMTGTNTIDGTDHTITVTATATDGDGDISQATWDVTFAGAETLQGTSGSDALVDGDGNDILIGGGGNDVLTGGSGSDTFKYESLSDGQDTITDFNIAPTASGGDVLNLQDVLAGAGSTVDTAVAANDVSTVDNYVYFTVSGTTATLHVDSAGGGAGTALASFQVTSGTSADNLLQTLLTNHQIVT